METIVIPAGIRTSKAFALAAVAGLAIIGCLQEPERKAEPARLAYAAATAAGKGLKGYLDPTVTEVTSWITPQSPSPAVTEWNYYGAYTASSVSKGEGSPNLIQKTNIGSVQWYSPSPGPATKYFRWKISPASTSEESKNGVYASAVGNGFKIQLPGSTQAREAVFYVAVNNAYGEFKATVEGNASLGEFTQELSAVPAEGNKVFRLRVFYRTPSGTTPKLNVAWTKKSGSGYIVLHSASYRNFDDVAPTISLQEWDTKTVENTTNFDAGMCVIDHQCNFNFSVSNMNAQPEGINTIKLYYNGMPQFVKTGVPTTGLILVTNPVATKYTLKVEVLDNLGNLSTYTKVVSPWYEAVFNGPTDIPDYSPGGIFWYAKVEQPGLNTTVAEWRMRLNITHPYVGDLVAEYGPPNISLDQGELLFNQVGGSGQNFTNTTIADKVATQSIKSSGAAAPFTGNFKGESRVLSANTILVNGWHTLKIKDIASSDWGQMNNVRILFRFN